MRGKPAFCKLQLLLPAHRPSHWAEGSTHLPLCQLIRGQDDVLLNKRLYQAPALPAIVSQHVCDGPVGLYQRRGVGL